MLFCLHLYTNALYCIVGVLQLLAVSPLLPTPQPCDHQLRPTGPFSALTGDKCNAIQKTLANKRPEPSQAKTKNNMWLWVTKTFAFGF